MKNLHPIIGFKLSSPDGTTPSSRLRGLLPLEVLRQNGVPAELYQPRHQDQYKLVVFQKNYSVKEQQLARALKQSGTLIVLDLCDNVFFNPLHDEIYARKAREAQKMLDIADVVTVSTPELAKHFNSQTVWVRDGVERIAKKPSIPLLAMNLKNRLHNNSRFRELVWFGVAESECGHRLMLQLLRLKETLACLQRSFNLRLTVLSNKKRLYHKHVRKLPLPTRYFQWRSYEGACQLLQQHEICLLPISLDPFTACKTHNRLTLALSAGLGVVGDSIPSYQRFAPYCFLDRWEEGLRAYLSDPSLRQQHVNEGQKFIKNNFMVEHSAYDWWRLFHSMLPGAILPCPYWVNEFGEVQREVMGRRMKSALGKGA